MVRHRDRFSRIKSNPCREVRGVTEVSPESPPLKQGDEWRPLICDIIYALMF